MKCADGVNVECSKLGENEIKSAFGTVPAWKARLTAPILPNELKSLNPSLTSKCP